MPRTNQTASDSEAAQRKCWRNNKNIAVTISTIAAQSAIEINILDDVCFAKAGHEPIAMPEANTIAMATAGTFIRRALTLQAFRCDRSAETSRRNPST